MSALGNHDQFISPESARDPLDQNPAREVQILEERWLALHEQAQAIAFMAALSAEDYAGELAGFPRRVDEMPPEARDFISRSLKDIDAILQPGISALLMIQSRGQDPTPAALSLWREFYNARKAVMELRPPC